ncbi:MAG: hypothetical protein Q8891_16800 [Bacteroidota bacterium]|nr:hypothetical protein [Bacteroidota bacterium]
MRKYPKWFFILFPAVSMLLGWGLRGFIGGGPYGAMIPGAMVMLAICMLLDIPFTFAAVAVVFGTVGIGMGGEMTYGQTLGFLRHTDIIWWGTCGTSLKGGVWGLLSGIFVGLGLVYKQIKPKIIIVGLFLFLIGFIIGLKLINDPRILYFSDPFNKPRAESWGGLLFAGIALLAYLKVKISPEEFRLIFRFAFYGLIGGALGFGLGGLWLAVGALYGANFFIVDWWKMMEFSFGFIMGGFLGYAAWLTRNFKVDNNKVAGFMTGSLTKELFIACIAGFFIYLAVPALEPFVEAGSNGDWVHAGALATIGRVVVSYTFLGSLLIMIALRWPYVAFQIAVMLTFSHTVIDLVTDKGLFPELQSSSLIIGLIIVVASLFISLMVAKLQRKKLVLKSMFLLLVWSTMAVAIIRMLIHSQFHFSAGHSFLQIIIGDMFIFNVFIISALIISQMTIKHIDAT